MQGRLENQIKTEKRIREILKELPREVTEYYINFSSNREYRSCQSYVEKLRTFLTWYSNEENINIMDIDFSKITDLEIANYLKKIEFKNTKDGVKYTSFSYRKQIWSILNSFFDFLDRKRYIDNNPVRLIDRPTKKDKVNHIFLKQNDLDAMIQAVVNGAGSETAKMHQKEWKKRDLAILYTFMFTGMRVSALSEIDMNRIDFENNILEVTDKEHKKNTYVITPKLKTVLLDWIEKRNEILNDIECDALFISRYKQRISSFTVRHLINKFSVEAIGQKISPHRLRAAFANIIYEETGSMEKTRIMMKHENVQTTLIYIENNDMEVSNEVANILENVF